MKLLALLLLVLFTFPVATSQESEHTQTLKATAQRFRNGNKFEVAYDRFKNETRVRMDGLVLKTKPRLEMRFSTSFTGVRPYRTRSLVLGFRTWEKLSRFNFHRELEVIADGKRSRFAKGTWLDRKTAPDPHEDLLFGLTLEEADEIASAQLTEIRVGMVEIVLSSEHKEALRDFLSLVKPLSTP